MELINISLDDVDKALEIINSAKQHLKEQGINQWLCQDHTLFVADCPVEYFLFYIAFLKLYLQAQSGAQKVIFDYHNKGRNDIVHEDFGLEILQGEVSESTLFLIFMCTRQRRQETIIFLPSVTGTMHGRITINKTQPT